MQRSTARSAHRNLMRHLRAHISLQRRNNLSDANRRARNDRRAGLQARANAPSSSEDEGLVVFTTNGVRLNGDEGDESEHDQDPDHVSETPEEEEEGDAEEEAGDYDHSR